MQKPFHILNMNTKLLIVLVSIVLIGVSNALYFDLRQGKMKCFKDAYKSQQIISGDIVVPPSLNKILSFWVEGPENYVAYTNNSQTTAKFVFTAPYDGVYSYCFVDTLLQRGGEETRRIGLTMTIIEDEADSKIEEGDLKPLQKKMSDANKLAEQLEKTSWELKDKEKEHRSLSDNLNSRVSWLSIFTILTVLGLGLVQVYYLERYLKKTKYID